MAEDRLAPLGLPASQNDGKSSRRHRQRQQQQQQQEQLAQQPFIRLHRTPTDHFETMVLAEDDHGHPHETPVHSRRHSSSETAVPSHTSEEHGEEEEDEESRSNRINDPERGDPEKKKGRKNTGGLTNRKSRNENGQGGEENSQDPKTRDWKDDVVTFDSKGDMANPKNWSSKRKVRCPHLCRFLHWFPLLGHQSNEECQIRMLTTCTVFYFSPLLF